MWAKIIATLTGQTVEHVLAYMNAKRQLKATIELEKLKGKAEYERAKTQRASESEGRDHEWEMESIRNSGWKDEWVLIVLSIPMILAFVPATVVYVQMGFSALEQTPVWYRVIVASVYLATFGLRLWRRDVNVGTNLVKEIT
jgi:hypothetical protein